MPNRQPPWALEDLTGVLGASHDPQLLGQTISTTSGVMRLSRVRLRAPTVSVTNIIMHISTAGATLTSGQNLVGIYSSAGTLLASTGDQSAVWTSTGTKTMALTGGPVSIASGVGWVWVGALPKGTTSPAFVGYFAASSTIGNLGVTASTAWNGTYSSALSALPSPLTPASINLDSARLFAALT